MVEKNSSRWTHKRGGGDRVGVGGTTGDAVLRQKFKGLPFLAGG